MSGKMVWLSGLGVVLLGLGTARGQAPGPAAGDWAIQQPGAGSAPFTGAYTPHSGNGAGGPWNADGVTAPLSQGALAPGGVTAPGTQGQGGPPTYPPGVSPWLTYARAAGCCGPLGGGPLGYEAYMRSGVSAPAGGGVFGNTLDPGWNIEGGGRLLLFNPEVDAAWTIGLGVRNTHYSASPSAAGSPILLFNLKAQGKQAVSPSIGPLPGGVQSPATTVLNFLVDSADGTMLSYNQTSPVLNVGREWYIWGPASCCNNGCNWRVGCDAGGAFGTDSARLNYFNANLTTIQNTLFPGTAVLGGLRPLIDPATLHIFHRTGVYEQALFSVHTDMEIPWGCCIFQAGVRAEANYSWSNILGNTNNASLFSANLMVTLGARF